MSAVQGSTEGFSGNGIQHPNCGRNFLEQLLEDHTTRS
jgi:hypothetical protein